MFGGYCNDFYIRPSVNSFEFFSPSTTFCQIKDELVISNSNWTEWSTIQGVIGRVISNRLRASRSADLKLLAILLPELYETKSNY